MSLKATRGPLGKIFGWLDLPFSERCHQPESERLHARRHLGEQDAEGWVQAQRAYSECCIAPQRRYSQRGSVGGRPAATLISSRRQVAHPTEN